MHAQIAIRLVTFIVVSLTMTGQKKLPPKIADADLSPDVRALVEKARKLYIDKLAYFVQNHKPPAFVVSAPGRVNLIGEHTDYTGGFVMPLAIDYSTVIYGTGFLHTGKGAGPTTIRLRMVSDKSPNPDLVEERRLMPDQCPPDENEQRTWVNYVVGVVMQYMPDLPREGAVVDLAFATASNVPLGSGLSSSASLEVAVAIFLECFMHDMAYSSNPDCEKEKERALRCQKAENEWAYSPCGIMDQLASSAAKEGHLTMIDCRSLGITLVPMKEGGTEEDPVIFIANSKVEHSIGDGEYGLRRMQCNEALEGMQQVPLYHVLTLRDATLQDVKDAEEKMSEVAYHRAKHVVTENQRTKEAKIALKMGVWDRVGQLMNESHESLRDDFEVSCEEVDFLVDLAQKYEGVYGSRMTGGGFGGCTVTLVKKSAVEGLKEHLKEEYKAKFNKDPDCFVTHPGPGARVLAIDKDCHAESDFYKK